MKTIVIIAAALALFTAFPRPVLGAPQGAPAVRIIHVSPLDVSTNTWTITLSSGDTMRVDLRAFETGGKAPTVGAISSFSDQGWLPILGYYGYATFVQHEITYHATR